MKYLKEVKTRVTWLLIGLVLSLGIAQVIERFETTLKANLILATFIPLVVYMSDAVGTQMEAMVIRELNTPGKFHFGRFLRQQLVIVSLVAVIVGTVSGLVVGWQDSSELGVVIGLSVVGGIMSSLVTGTVLPFIFWKMHDDPAEASGPIATVLQDLMSVLIFFLIAQAIL